MRIRVIEALLGLAIIGSPLAGAVDVRTAYPGLRESPQIVRAERAPIIAATNAGKRIIAVGDYGLVILSDDGKNFRQARRVPTRAVLTGIFFLDGRRGWACGHDGTVLGTTDGGESWRVLREDPGKESALLSVWFENPEHGFAVGQFGTVVETEDGGKTWKDRRLVEGEAGERHLMQIFAAGNGLVLVAGETGAIYRSEDAGRNWRMIQTDNKGSFWTGIALSDGSLVAAGMRGHIYRSEDRGLTWRETPSGTQQSLTGILAMQDGEIRLVGISGTLVTSGNKARGFIAALRPDRANITAIAAGPAGPVLFSIVGVLPP